MRFYDNEAQARTEIAATIRPIYQGAHLFIAERNTVNISLREVLFVASVKSVQEKTEQLINAFYQLQVSGTSERLEWVGTKIDFMNDRENEYIMIKAVIQNQ